MKKTQWHTVGLFTVIALIPMSEAGAAQARFQPAPNLVAQTMAGRAIDLEKLQGKKPVYLKFWATWCSYCKEEMPHLQAIKDKYGNKVEVLSVNVGFNQTPETVQRYMHDNGYTIPVVFDADGSITRQFNVVGTPQHILIDRDGQIEYRTFLATDKLDQIIHDWSEKTY